MPAAAEKVPPHPTAAVDSVVAAWAASPDRAVLFDFNGTLSDDEPLLYRIYAEMFSQELGRPLTQGHYYSHLAGLSDREIIRLMLEELGDVQPDLEAALIRQRRDRYRELVEEATPITPAAAELVELLHDRQVTNGIVTGAEREDVEFVLEGAGLRSRFGVIVAAADVAAGKPDPEGFLRAAAALELDPSGVLVFEDSLPGIRAAHAAGMRCIAVAGTGARDKVEREADAVIDHLSPAAFSVLGRQPHRWAAT
jgi:beta-phosphoglucomutase